ncbi:hypothetical protein HTZ77_03310 [Nonomuraea sp. SMC257]|uniref:Uncharacterized protein n=1 Tax=Nonomuraea montanisoli TaxID=2741721 RepID=A0A7Y6I2E0_9ACTN|nr:hypothetical protein [Nonomuraea montanisoli]NUW30457.1 hypothetical protein [Nonomuraea montanisoli]
MWGRPSNPPPRSPLSPASFDLPASAPTRIGGHPLGAFKQPPASPAPPAAQPSKAKRAVLAVVGVLVLGGVATGGFFAYKSLSAPASTAAGKRTSAPASAPPSSAPTGSAPTESAPTDSAPTAASPTASTSPGATAATMLDSEATDKRKLSLSEAFGEKKVEAAGTTFSRVETDMENDCRKAAAGPFAEALHDQKCSRVLRATYVDSKRRYAVTSGIAVLPSKDAAMRADQSKNLGRNLWFRALPGPGGSGGERVDIAGGYAAGLVWGRYIVFSYATYADGHTPAAKDRTLGKVSDAFRDEMSLVLERRISND